MGIADKTENALDFRELAETCPAGLMQVDAQGHCSYANAECVRLLDVVDPLGTGWMQAVHPLDQATASAMWHRPYDTLGIERILRVERLDGPMTHVRLRAAPLASHVGKLRGYTVSLVDVTPSASKLERLESANAFLARAEAIAGVGCWRFDIRTRELQWTSNMRRIHELPDDYVPRGDEHVKYFSAGARMQLEDAVRQSIASGQSWDLRLPMRTAKGRELWVRSVGEPQYEDGRLVAVTGVLHDITQLVRLGLGLPAKAGKPRVLVVDDNPINQVVAVKLLQKLGCEDIDVANDGSEAVRMAAQREYGLVLMDCQMPVMDGYEATRRLREAGCRSLIVAVTATVVDGARERCLEAGMDEFLGKPIDIGKLQWVLARQAERSGRH
ncbi:response regulator [Ramlibacter sp. G-1-2-2]|uniref:Response regulator n=1 Tax=Ramlibacter agri TaxID=2728837 RepID=A0A848GUI7_9BURK|nr:response regulator [Ramlibacter agri]NML42285.1 response regulator [Ramlibacter agri]